MIENQSSADCMVRGFKKLGHNVVTCGPEKNNFSGTLLSKHDLPIYDKIQHPETYSYDEIIGLYNAKYGYKPHLIIQTDPHFYLIGNKPKDIISVYWIMDVHRGPVIFRQMALEGNFDKIFIAQKYYMPVFERVDLDCEYLPWAYDDDLIYEHPEIKIECDIAFIGNSGLFKQDDWFEWENFDEELELPYINLGKYHFKNEEKFLGWENRSMEYAERIELLYRLSGDFNVRIYKRCFDLEKVAKVMSRGKIGFHHSLRRDITLRIFEVPAVNCFLITDEIPYLDELMNDGIHLRTYRQYYQPQFSGFDLDYEEVKNLVDEYLINDVEREKIAKQGLMHVKSYHTFRNRASEMLYKLKRM